MSETIYIASDHGGFNLKAYLSKYLEKKSYNVDDLGTHSMESCDYPLFAQKLCEAVREHNGLGILVCGSGVGMSMAANRFDGIRAASCTNEYMARMSRRHNDANVLCLGERILGLDLATDIVDAFLANTFDGGRHLRRVELFSKR